MNVTRRIIETLIPNSTDFMQWGIAPDHIRDSFDPHLCARGTGPTYCFYLVISLVPFCHPSPKTPPERIFLAVALLHEPSFTPL